MADDLFHQVARDLSHPIQALEHIHGSHTPATTQGAPMADTLHAAIYRDVMTRLDAVVKDAIDRWLTPDNMLGAVGDVLDSLRHQQAPTPPPPPAAVQDTAPDVVQPADADADPAA